MPIFLILGIYLLLFSGNGKRARWNLFLYDGSVEDENSNYDVSNFISMTTWRLFFLDGDIKAEMISLPWNNFL
jgi:hypothetical protein